MKLIPSEKIELTTAFTTAEIEKLLMENIREHKSYKVSFNKEDTKSGYFIGHVYPNGFSCKKFTYQRNSFLPQGTNVKINLKIDSFITIFLYLFNTVIFCVFLVTLYMVTTQSSAPYIASIPLAILLTFTALPHIGFQLEKEHTIAELKKILTS
ncbi:hypothetical protein [Maribacter sp. 1_2014MBL_MicDiv]|uniref:hypothetical protein n=1 Tax=Maribacter sp. 1_2014MBL_MicDiv TaxID=1644130 RepID=UPI0008F49E0B|nr:hypothetical protein [Maribacter sp. 1_2014MBL_MicDiv]APA64904.1 hypothetical protein YQ22_11590 [Maribacter sp. 1_2014MBL_MicDiv]